MIWHESHFMLMMGGMKRRTIRTDCVQLIRPSILGEMVMLIVRHIADFGEGIIQSTLTG